MWYFFGFLYAACIIFFWGDFSLGVCCDVYVVVLVIMQVGSDGP
jgi:hypothetical protein